MLMTLLSRAGLTASFFSRRPAIHTSSLPLPLVALIHSCLTVGFESNLSSVTTLCATRSLWQYQAYHERCHHGAEQRKNYQLVARPEDQQELLKVHNGTFARKDFRARI